MALRFDLYAAAALAPGVGSLADLFALRRTRHLPTGATLELPSPQALPANERRRASPVVRLALACADQAVRASPFPVEALRLVFASDEGTGEVCQQMLETLATTRSVSPLLFHNSVHNAPAGYFSIGYRNRQASISVSLGQESFASGLLCAASEAQTSGQPVLFLSYDPPMPEPMRTLLPIRDATATAWIIATGSMPTSNATPIASFELTLHADLEAATRPLPAWLPDAWAANSSAHGLAVLALLDALPDESRHCELKLGSQVLRVERTRGVPAC